MPRTLTDDELDLYGLKSASDNGVLFCGVTQQFAVGNVTYKWPVNSGLTWSLGAASLGKLTSADIKQVYADFFAEVASACNFDCQYSPNAKTANFLFTVARLDGPSGVLADHQFPMNTRNQQLIGRYDVSEAWVIAQNPPRGTIDFQRVAWHEGLHGLGLGHGKVDPRDPALIEPSYSLKVRTFQRRDIAELVRRYGPAKNAEPTKPTPGGEPSVNLQVVFGGETWEATGAMRRVK